MTDTDLLRDEVDRLDTGLPDAPDLASIRAAGSRVRRGRRLAALAGGAALVVATVVPATLLLGGSPDTPPSGPAVAAVPEAPVEAGPGFGQGMTEAVDDVFPGAGVPEEELGDHWVWRDRTNLDFETGTPTRWETLFTWNQYYDLSGVPLSVVARREAPSPSGPAAYGSCRGDRFLVEAACDTWVDAGRTVVAHDGTQVEGQAPGTWLRSVEVYGPAGAGGMVSTTWVTVTGEGASWKLARQSLPTVGTLADLALDDRLVLPEPARYPREFPADRPGR